MNKSRVVDAEIVKEQWNIKRVLIFVIIILLVLGAFLYTDRSARFLFLPSTYHHKQVEGVGTSSSASSAGTFDMQQKIDQIKKEIQNINAKEVIDKSPQVQKVMNDIKALQGVPVTQTRGLCENICKTL